MMNHSRCWLIRERDNLWTSISLPFCDPDSMIVRSTSEFFSLIHRLLPPPPARGSLSRSCSFLPSSLLPLPACLPASLLPCFLAPRRLSALHSLWWADGGRLSRTLTHSLPGSRSAVARHSRSQLSCRRSRRRRRRRSCRRSRRCRCSSRAASLACVSRPASSCSLSLLRMPVSPSSSHCAASLHYREHHPPA